MTWRVRAASLDDVGRLALVGSATFLETFGGILAGEAIVDHCAKAHSAKAYEQALRSDALAWLAEVDPEACPIGFALLGPPDLPGASHDGSDLELKRIYLLSKFQGEGIGAALIREAVASARRKCATRLLLGVYAGNTHAQEFYRKAGFSFLTSRRFRVGSKDYDDTVLALSLS